MNKSPAQPVMKNFSQIWDKCIIGPVTLGRFHQGCAGRPFIPRGGAKVKIHGAGRGEGENLRGGAGRGEKARKSTNSKNLQKCEKYNITYYNINYNIIIIL